MDFRRLQGRLLQICDGSFVVRLRSPTSGASLAECDVRIPVSQHTRAEGLIEFDVREDFARDFIGPNTARVELIESKPKVEAIHAQLERMIRAGQGKYHPDVALTKYFPAVEISADFNALAEVLRMIHSSKE